MSVAVGDFTVADSYKADTARLEGFLGVVEFTIHELNSVDARNPDINFRTDRISFGFYRLRVIENAEFRGGFNPVQT